MEKGGPACYFLSFLMVPRVTSWGTRGGPQAKGGCWNPGSLIYGVPNPTHDMSCSVVQLLCTLHQQMVEGARNEVTCHTARWYVRMLNVILREKEQEKQELD